ncbi:hypothetical protein CMI37_25720 [Candidatus Pacearchaeota archaeon]|nr:hypothetical protein [Candidatus Pacearchaeota archaeon]|tara:strand:+ start:544 stop:732 length:189 start_codon:yes stop_codon:yes gene_type:complete
MSDSTVHTPGPWRATLENALADINWLLVEGFDTNADECNIDGVRDTIAEIKQLLANAKGESE